MTRSLSFWYLSDRHARSRSLTSSKCRVCHRLSLSCLCRATLLVSSILYSSPRSPPSILYEYVYLYEAEPRRAASAAICDDIYMHSSPSHLVIVLVIRGSDLLAWNPLTASHNNAKSMTAHYDSCK